MQPSLEYSRIAAARTSESKHKTWCRTRPRLRWKARLVERRGPKKKFEQIAAFIAKQGFYVIDHEPTMEERTRPCAIAKVVYEGGYRASRTPMDLPVSKRLWKL